MFDTDDMFRSLEPTICLLVVQDHVHELGESLRGPKLHIEGAWRRKNRPNGRLLAHERRNLADHEMLHRLKRGNLAENRLRERTFSSGEFEERIE